LESLLQPNIQPQALNRCWVAKITIISTYTVWRCLHVWIVLFSRVVGWKIGSILTPLMIEALDRALGHRQVAPDRLPLHTD
jgi:hypothetical protein